LFTADDFSPLLLLLLALLLSFLRHPAGWAHDSRQQERPACAQQRRAPVPFFAATKVQRRCLSICARLLTADALPLLLLLLLASLQALGLLGA
jgi:hypothetical protein